MAKKKKKENKITLWGGRFEKKIDARFFAFSSSLPEDRRFYLYELAINRAYAQALHKLKLLSSQEKDQLMKAITKLESEKPPEEGYEDIHSYIEARLARECKAAAQKIHLGRSRNDLVLTSQRLYLKDEITEVKKRLLELQKALFVHASKHKHTLLPAFTHRQPAQPTSLAHFFLSYFFGLERDKKRLGFALEACNVLPLGSCSAVGTNIPLDQKALASKLRFSTIVENSLDMVGDRDFILDTLHSLNLLALRLSRLAEDLLFFAHPYVGILTLPEEFCTGSSAMPHKKNPDALELVRARTARTMAAYQQMSCLIKGLGSSYHRDLQEDKKCLFTALDSIKETLSVFLPLIKKIAFQPEKCAALLQEEMLALDLAEKLAMKGLSFRESHFQVGKWIKEAEQAKSSFLKRVQRENPEEELNFTTSVFQKKTAGSPGDKPLQAQLHRARLILRKNSS